MTVGPGGHTRHAQLLAGVVSSRGPCLRAPPNPCTPALTICSSSGYKSQGSATWGCFPNTAPQTLGEVASSELPAGEAPPYFRHPQALKTWRPVFPSCAHRCAKGRHPHCAPGWKPQGDPQETQRFNSLELDRRDTLLTYSQSTDRMDSSTTTGRPVPSRQRGCLRVTGRNPPHPLLRDCRRGTRGVRGMSAPGRLASHRPFRGSVHGLRFPAGPSKLQMLRGTCSDSCRATPPPCPAVA